MSVKLSAVYTQMGDALKNKRQLDEAIACFRQAIALDPKAVGPHFALGLALRTKGQPDEAIASFRKTLALNPKHAQAHRELGLDLSREGQWDEAIASLRQAIELDPRYAPTHAYLVGALRDKGRLNEAIASYRKAIELDPKYARPYSYMGGVLREKGRLDEAIAAYHKTIELEPTYFGAREGLGQALARKGQRDGAIASFRKAIELNPKAAPVHALLGNLLKDTGQLDEALASYRKAIELDPKLTWTRAPFAKAQRLVVARDKLPAFQDGRYTPASNQERLDLAEWCHIRALHHTSVRLYAEAFAADPKRADDLGAGHRYTAACSAALAAARKGDDAATLDDPQRAGLRKQALDWLRADLALRARQLDSRSPADRTTASTAMNQWQQDSQLAGIRNPEALAQLPEGDRKLCETLWAEVQALLDRAAKTAP